MACPFSDLLRQCHPSIRKYTDLRSLFPYLRQAELVSSEDNWVLNNELISLSSRIDYLIGILPTKGDGAESLFMLCLGKATEHRGHHTLIELLQEVISNRAMSIPDPLKDTIEEFCSTFDKLRKVISDLSNENATLNNEKMHLQQQLEKEKTLTACYKELLEQKPGDDISRSLPISVMKLIDKVLQPDEKGSPKQLPLPDAVEYATQEYGRLEKRTATLEMQNKCLIKVLEKPNARSKSALQGSPKNGPVRNLREKSRTVTDWNIERRYRSQRRKDEHESLVQLQPKLNAGSIDDILCDQVAKPIKAGLLKKEGGLTKNWKQRYVMLTQGYIVYYEPEHQDEKYSPLGIIQIEELQLKSVDDQKVKHCFEISHSGGGIISSLKLKKGLYIPGNHNAYRMQASNETDKNLWMQEIQEAISSSAS